jgi:signal transduction histidine kinase
MNPSINFKTLYNIFRDLSTVVHSSTSVDEVLELVVWKSTEVLDAKGAVLRVLNRKTDEKNMFAAYGMSEEYLSKDPVSKDETIVDLCLRKKLDIVRDLTKNGRVNNAALLEEEGVRMILDIPLILRDHLLGLLRIFFPEPRAFSEEEQDFLTAVAEQCACAIDKARMIEEQQDRYQHLASYTEKLSALGRMAAGIAHEINNPLAGILLYSSNMRKKVQNNGPFKEGLDVIIQESQRCKGIIQDLLEFSRDKEPEKSMGNLNRVIEKAVGILINEFHIHHIRLEKTLAEDIPDSLLDINLMQQVFVNLFINAVEAIQDNGVITTSSRMSRNGKWAVVEVSDTGSGIPEDHLSRLFEPFFSTKIRNHSET